MIKTTTGTYPTQPKEYIMAGKFKVEEGVRATVDGKSGEVLGTYDDGVRFRFDDGTTTLVKEGDIGKYEEPKADAAEAPADEPAE